ncbi:MAG: molybdopterin-binding protein [Proteobacteria bacterium]|nr:molybdopterin-binding protein [Pseudomonadota bacterium]
MKPERRGFLSGLVLSTSALVLAGCNKIANSSAVDHVLTSAEAFNRRMGHFFVRPKSLAREYSRADISRFFKPNGSIAPDNPADASSTPAYRAHVASNFADWRLVIDGLVEHPQTLSIADLKAMPAKAQITRHDCVEGWSSIAEWRGVQLARLLQKAQLKPNAKYIVFHCADAIDKNDDGSPLFYYESIDLEDAFHPQTILAYAMNGQPLPVPHGAPLRLRVERQLGYKQAKYVMRVEAVDSYKRYGQGKGGYWEDNGYEWYAGI